MENFGLIAGLGVPELLIIFMIIVVLFGAKLLPKLSRSVGESANELRKGFGSKKIQNGASNRETAQASAGANSASSGRAPRI